MGITIINSGQGSVVRFRNLGRGGVMTSTKLPSTLLLNNYPGAAAAYSLRKLDYTYTGAAIRVRRSSDNAEQNIGFVNNNLDTASLLAFCGAGSGFVTTWYDQSGNARNAVQETTTNQPTIVALGVLQVVNDKASIKFISSSFTRLTLSGILSGNQQRTQIAVYRPTVTSGVLGVFGQGTDPNTGKWSYIQARSGVAAGDPYFAGYNDDLGNNLSVMNTDAKIGTFLYNGSIGYLWKNNTQLASGSLVLNTSGSEIVQIGMSGRSGFFEPMEGFINECILYASNQLSNISGINSNINSYYSIYTPTWQGTGTALLDLYPSSAAAYSLRNLSSTYLGPLVRVRRSSDNAEQDIYGTPAGQLDTTSLLTFCGVGNGFVTTWYDQSGNSRNSVQATTANQPIIVNSGTIQLLNNKPAIYFDTVNSNLATSYGFPGATSFIFDVLKTSDTRFNLYHSANGGLTIISVAISGDTSTSINYNATVFNYYKNGVVQTSPTNRNEVYLLIATGLPILLTHKCTMTGWTAFNLSGYTSGASEHIHYRNEIIIYNTDQTSNRTAIESNINSNYTIY